jgi:copper chaperone CopZ
MAMKRLLISAFAIGGLALSAAWAADGDKTVTLKDVHICCGSCVTGVKTATTPIKGLTAVASQADKTVVLTAADKETLQKGVDALVAAGYFGKSSDDTVKVNAVTGAKDGKVQSVDIEGVHLCCNSCVTAMKDVLKKVDGVKTDTVKSKATSFNVAGDFDSKALFAEMQKAGLTGKVAAPK